MELANLSDSEFLDFLYSERNREEARQQYLGISTWVLLAAMVGVVCYIYQVVKTAPSIDGVWMIRYLCIGWSYVLSFKGWRNVLLPYRWKDHRSVIRVKDSAPIFNIVFVLIVSLIIIGFVSVAAVPTWYLIGVWCLYLAIQIRRLAYVIYFGDDYTIQHWNECTFKSEKLEDYVSYAEVFLLTWISSVATYSWGSIRFAGRYEAVELASGILAVIVLHWLFLRHGTPTFKRGTDLDLLIDEYLYGNLSKTDVISRLLVLNQGISIVVILENAIKKARNTDQHKELVVNKMSEWRARVKSNNVTSDYLREILDFLHDELTCQRQLFHEMDGLLDCMQNLTTSGSQDIASSAYREKFAEASTVLKGINDNMNFLLDETAEVHSYLSPLVCKRYGSYCEKLDCPDRNRAFSWWYKQWRYLYSRISGLSSKIMSFFVVFCHKIVNLYK